MTKKVKLIITGLLILVCVIAGAVTTYLILENIKKQEIEKYLSLAVWEEEIKAFNLVAEKNLI